MFHKKTFTGRTKTGKPKELELTFSDQSKTTCRRCKKEIIWAKGNSDRHFPIEFDGKEWREHN